MRIRRAGLLGAALLLTASARGGVETSRSVPSDASRRGTPGEALRASPFSRSLLHFEANRGQADPQVRFLARARGYRAFFTDTETVFVMPRDAGAPRDPGHAPSSRGRAADVVRMRFEGAKATAPVPGEALGGRSNYLLGSDPEKWVTGVPHHREIVALDIYPGVGIRWRGLPGRRLEYDLLVAPGGDPGAVVIRFGGARSVSMDADGGLLVETEGGVLRHGRPVAFQEAAGLRRPVEARFALLGDGRAGFRLGRHDPGSALVIDPEIDHSTFLGGSNTDEVLSLATDGTGAVYAAGKTESTNFPMSGAFQGTKSSSSDAYVAKFDPAGTALVYSTFLGGNDTDIAYALAVDGDGEAALCGTTGSANFPTSGALQAGNAGQYDAFVARLGASGSSLVHSTYLGTAWNDFAFGLALASDGGAVVCGSTASSAFPTTSSAFQRTVGGLDDGFVFKLNANGSALAWSTYLGGSGQDQAFDVAVDGSDRPVVVGYAYSSNFPTAGAAQGSNGGAADSFATMLAADGSGLVWSTFFGGSADDFGNGVAVAPDGRVWIAGKTDSSNLPLTNAFQAASGGGTDAFVARLSSTGNAFQMSTYLGGGGDDVAEGITVDRDGASFVVGFTGSSDFPLQAPVQGAKGLQFDLFLTMFKASDSPPSFSTYLGGSGEDRGYAVTVDPRGLVLVGGSTNGTSSTYPVQNAYQGTYGGGMDGVLTAIRRLPYAPGGLTASLTSLTSAEIAWTDVGPGESGYRIERATDGVNFSVLAVTAPDTTTYADTPLSPSTTYTYRLRTVAGAYQSDPTEEVSVTTPATPTSAPAAPSDLAATVVSARRVDLAWQDNSDNESFFSLSRAAGPGFFATLATPRLGATAATDSTPLPDWTYSFKIRAVNPVGPSLDSNVETVTMPSTLAVGLVKGRILDREVFGKDAVTLTGTLAYAEGAESEDFDPATQSFTLRLGTMADPPMVLVPPGDEGWSLRRGRYAWKSPRGSGARARIVVDPEAGTWTFRVSRTAIPVALGNPLRVTLAAGTDGGHFEGDWTLPTRAGVRRFPVPVPKE